LLGSGAILREVLAAAELLASGWNIASDIWSVTSFSELARDARETERYNRLHPSETPRGSHLADCLTDTHPVIAATDYVVALPHLIGGHLRQRFVALGTDGFGRSDTRAALRSFFEVDRHHIVVAALHALAMDGVIPDITASAAIERYGLATEALAPWTR
jgi:pyruvate dehydrogenase E1 component